MRSVLHIPRSTVGPALAHPHRGVVELGALAALYALYEIMRGFGDASIDVARRHTDEIVALERALHVFAELAVQEAAHALPLLPAALGVAYIALHFAGTTAALLWVYRSHRAAFPVIRNALIVSTGLSLVVYVLYPVAPPRLADLGFADTVTSHTGLNLSSDLLGSLYNPFAAVPSLHFGYALLVGIALAQLARRRWLRALGATYPAFMLVVIVATGNHFLFDAAAGGVVTLAGWFVARRVARASAAPVSTLA